MNQTPFIGSRVEGETAVEHAAREAEWMEDHACLLCGEFDCDGSCEDYDEEVAE